VNGYRKHFYETIGNVARHLVAKWKQLVQLTTEAISDSQHAEAASDDRPASSDVKEKVSVRNDGSLMSEHHSVARSSKHKHSHASSSSASLRHHSSTAVKYSKVNEQDGDDKSLSSRCLQTKVSAASVTPSYNDQCGGGSKGSQNQPVTQRSALMSASAGHQKSSVEDLSLVSSTAGTHDKCCHEKLSKLSSTDKPQNKQKYHSDTKVSAKMLKSASNKKESNIILTESVHTNFDGFSTDRMSCESGRGLVSDVQVETDLSKSVRKSASKTKHDVREKKSHNQKSDSFSHSDASGPSSAMACDFGHVSKGGNQADVEPFTTADDMDDSKGNGISFEDMLNYDNRGSIVRKKKRSIHTDKCSKVSKSASHSSSLEPSFTTKCSSDHDSRHMSKRTARSMHTLNSSMSAAIDESERSQLSQRPVIPHPDSQVSTTTTAAATITTTISATVIVVHTCRELYTKLQS